ncbi:sensory rhodopsin transducer [Paracidovorax citrulli]
MEALGQRRWVIAEGYLPRTDPNASRQLNSHEAACLLNTGDAPANVTVMIFYGDREPAGPYRVTVPARRTLHLRFNDLRDPEPIPEDTDYASVIESDVPIVVQHTRLDSRQSALALMTTMAYAAG